MTKGSLEIVGRKSIVSMQKSASEGFQVTKPRNDPPRQCQSSLAEALRPQTNSELEQVLPPVLEHFISASQDALSSSEQNRLAMRGPAPSSHCSQDTVRACSLERYTNDQLFASNNDHDIARAPDYHEECETPVAEIKFGDREDFCDELNDEELLELTSDMNDESPKISHPWSSAYEPDAGRASVTDSQGLSTSVIASDIEDGEGSSTQRPSKKFVSPVTLTTRLLMATGDVHLTEARRPIVRPAFPDAVRERSPIIGLSSSTLLRTCFRIGETINQAHQANKFGKQVVFELYARILESKRDGIRQYFTFCDLFHGKPPYIKATYDATLWRSVQLFDYDSKRLLRQGRICRCMGRMQRTGKEWVMTVLNIWEATWDDIKWVEGILHP